MNAEKLEHFRKCYPAGYWAPTKLRGVYVPAAPLGGIGPGAGKGSRQRLTERAEKRAKENERGTSDLGTTVTFGQAELKVSSWHAAAAAEVTPDPCV